MTRDWIGGALALVGLPVLWLPALSELLCLLRRRRPPESGSASSPHPALLFLVPAHDEEQHIAQCVQSLVGMTYPASRREIVVIADNSTDATAALSRRHGAGCLERDDPTRPGKPQALAWAMGQFDLARFDAVVIVDADTVVAPDFAAGLARSGPLGDSARQANFLALNEADTWLTRLGGLLNRCRYGVSYPLKERAGINCPLTGNGMCIGTGVLRRLGWTAFSITEDSELYVQYTIAGVRIHHAAHATLYSQESSSLAQGATQRRRWLAGRLWVLRAYAGALLGAERIGWHQKLDTIVELVLSSPVLHLLCATACALVILLLDPWGAGGWLALAALGSLAGIGASTLVVLRSHPTPGRLLLDALRLPAYAAWRGALALRTMVTLRDRRWARTQRSAAGGERS